MGWGNGNLGGGAALNFKVVPGLTQPGTASENTIWVKTAQISSWYFSATQPEGLQEWDVWFPTGTASKVEFNALRKNAVQVYPLSAKQMVSGALVDVKAQSYQDGAWVEWITYIYKPGDNGDAFYAYKPSGAYAGQVSTVFGSDGISLKNTSTSGVYGVRIATNSKIDFTNYSKLYAKVIFNSIGSGTSVWTGFGVTPDRIGQSANYLAITDYVNPSVGEHIYEVYLDNVDQSGYVEYILDANKRTVDVKIISIWLE